MAYPRGTSNRPLVLIFPNYAGEKDFDVDQAIFLAQMGYAAVSVDMYKDVEWYPKRVRNPTLSLRRTMVNNLQWQHRNNGKKR